MAKREDDKAKERWEKADAKEAKERELKVKERDRAKAEKREEDAHLKGMERSSSYTGSGIRSVNSFMFL